MSAILEVAQSVMNEIPFDPTPAEKERAESIVNRLQLSGKLSEDQSSMLEITRRSGHMYRFVIQKCNYDEDRLISMLDCIFEFTGGLRNIPALSQEQPAPVSSMLTSLTLEADS